MVQAHARRSGRDGAEQGATSSTSDSATCPGSCSTSRSAHDVLSEGTFVDGHGFDGSSIRGFQQIQESDMILIPDPKTAYIDPFMQHKTLDIHCFVADPVTGESYSRDPRYVASKAKAYMMSTGIADSAYFGPESEFFIFDDVRFDTGQNSAFYRVDSIEGIWNTGRGRGPNLGYKPRYKRATSRFRPWTTTRTCARRWRDWRRSASRSSCITTR